jgi:hypothetical protein
MKGGLALTKTQAASHGHFIHCFHHLFHLLKLLQKRVNFIQIFPATSSDSASPALINDIWIALSKGVINCC